MTAFANITLVDSTSGDRVFAPSTIDPQGVAKLYEVADTLDERFGISLSVRPPKNGGNVARVTAKVVIPVMENGPSSMIKVGECIANMEFVIPKKATTVMRADLAALAASLLGAASVQAAINNLESIY